MKEITILSGKGGTGKTTIASAIASVAKNAVFCDNDVDAADLHLIMQPEIQEEHTFYGAWQAEIDNEKCINCGICIKNCRFNAIHSYEDSGLYINPFQCEGCRLCERICPQNAITSERSNNNYWYVSDTRFGKLVHACMGPGEENSGKLVTQVRKRAKEIAEETHAEYIINDGPPGIGCAAISSIAGTNKVLLVIEPTKSGMHDVKRLIELVESFEISIYAIINKSDINKDICTRIEKYLISRKIPLLTKIPFDKSMVESMIDGKSVIEFVPESKLSMKIKEVWSKIKI
ncbi:ATP-binding protein [Bacteroidota bacterium]